jgi:hypothetical protein
MKSPPLLQQQLCAFTWTEKLSPHVRCYQRTVGDDTAAEEWARFQHVRDMRREHAVLFSIARRRKGS